MFKFLLWCILLVLCWPLALLAILLYPVIWLLTCRSASWDSRWKVFQFVRAVILLPARILRLGKA